MICRNCPNAYIGKEESDKRMAVMGYRSCKLARTAEDRAKYVSGSMECLWLDRLR